MRPFLPGLLAVLTLGCGDVTGMPGAPADAQRLADGGGGRGGMDGGADGPDGAAPVRPCVLSGAPTVCPNDSSPCPGSCNERGFCEIDCGFDPEVRIPAGTFVAGSSVARRFPENTRNDRPYADALHLVTISRPFFIGKYELTWETLIRCIEDGACTGHWGSPDDYRQNILTLWSEPNHPASEFTRASATAVCHWLGGRLPTEAEWSYAARGPAVMPPENPGPCASAEDLQTPGRCNQRIFAWGDEADLLRAKISDLSMDGFKFSTPVGFYDGKVHEGFQTKDGSSPFGLYDMMGNVAEQVADWYVPAYYGPAPIQDPQGPTRAEAEAYAARAQDSLRVVSKGGTSAPGVITPFRTIDDRAKGLETFPDCRYCGVRCVRDVEDVSQHP